MSLITATPRKVVTVAGGNLFQLAGEHLGDATQWYRIARANRLWDPFLPNTPITLVIPAPAPGNGGILG